MEISTNEVKAIAKSIRKQLKEAGKPGLTHTLVLEGISAALGFKNWESLEAQLSKESSSKRATGSSKNETASHYYHFGNPEKDTEYRLLNGKNLLDIRGSMDLLPRCTIIDSVTVNEKGEADIQYVGDTVEMFDLVRAYPNDDAEMHYADENWDIVSESFVVRVPVRCGTDPDEFPIRRYLVRQYWKEIAAMTDILDFMAMPAKDRVSIIEKAYEKIGFALTMPERICLDENHVYDETLLVDWFGIACRMDNPDGDFMSGRMFETYGHDHTYVLSVNAKDPGRVWTWVDCDGELIVVSGYHYVNRIGYFISEKALPDNISSVDFADEDYHPDEDEDFDEESDEEMDD